MADGSPRCNARSKSFAWCLSCRRSGFAGRCRADITTLLWSARVRCVGRKEVRENREFVERRTRWTRSFPRTGGVLRANQKASARRSAASTSLDAGRILLATGTGEDACGHITPAITCGAARAGGGVAQERWPRQVHCDVRRHAAPPRPAWYTTRAG